MSYRMHNKGTRQDAYEAVTDEIIGALEKGTVPWRRPWQGVADGLPLSLASGKPYRGVNVFILGMAAAASGYSSPYWLTFNQARKLGGNVRRGERSRLVVFWKMLKVEDR